MVAAKSPKIFDIQCIWERISVSVVVYIIYPDQYYLNMGMGAFRQGLLTNNFHHA